MNDDEIKKLAKIIHENLESAARQDLMTVLQNEDDCLNLGRAIDALG